MSTTPPSRSRREPPSDPFDAPSRTPVPRLERVRSTEGLVDRESRLNQYVHNEAPVEPPVEPSMPWATPDEDVLRDNPFGSNPFGGETPFFTGGGSAPGFELDDTDGIPVGLPDLLHLPDEVPDLPVRAATTQTLVPEVDSDVDEAPVAPPAPQLPPRISADPPNGPAPLQMFVLGLGVASAAWLVVLVGWAWLTFAA